MQFLVFGLGRDSAIWNGINKGGQTVFLESNRDWITECATRNPEIDVRKVEYNTRRSDWERLLGDSKLDEFVVNEDVSSSNWDVILVDAPEGWNENTPGRMQSIHWANKLLADGGDLLIHDCDRRVESEYSEFYGRGMTFRGQTDKLRHYSNR